MRTNEHPDVTIAHQRMKSNTERIIVTVQDNGPRHPKVEPDVLTADQETALEHGSGLGLWFVTWGVASLGGTVDFDTDSSRTTVRLGIPAATT